jgi:GTP-binding protein HflX
LSRAGRDDLQGAEASLAPVATAEKAVVLAPVLSSDRVDEGQGALPPRGIGGKLEEAKGLARAIGLDIVLAEIVALKRFRPATLLGSGKVASLGERIGELGAGLAIVDHTLSPGQQRNLEKEWNCKVLDRTGLILEIFGARARTREGRLQVELASLNYQKSRLVRQWTHLERQRGGLGKTGGPGETQIEADRRLIQERILGIENELAKVRRTRELHRAKRRKAPVAVVALVGYTNAGKSTLFNRLTGAGVLARDMLFATLDPTLRRLKLPDGGEIVLSDTVGFISELPTQLVAAFRATLEEVLEADLILHVRDMADPDNAAQAADVYAVLRQIGIGEAERGRIVEVWNKIDRLDGPGRDALRQRLSGGAEAVAMVSAATGEGLSDLLDLLQARVGGGVAETEILLPPSQLSRLQWIHENSEVLDRHYGEDGSVRLRLRAGAAIRDALRRHGLSVVADADLAAIQEWNESGGKRRD